MKGAHPGALPARALSGLLSLALVLSAGPLAADTGGPAAEGERLYRENKPEAALLLLEEAARDPAADQRVWLWLAVAYQQVGRLDEGIVALRKGLAKATADRHLFFFDLGNLYLLQGKAAFAKDMYDSAIAARGDYGPAWLNRANAEMATKDYRAARDDYLRYLDLEPASPQRANIEAVLARMGTALAAEDQQKSQAEAARLAEEAARKALLDQVAASLKAAAEETTNLAAGTGQIQGYGDELPASD